ncbi:MAG TPA: protein kinase [Bryobacteraceae bacterium]|nr:protein kinase [Bryobacteraceae bacterium]
MPLSAGTRLGPYEILAAIGAGGMGEVYRARDTKLDRDVAIKVLPAALAQDPERLARFEREAKVLAALNHPNIAQIYGVEERALVMELVEGETIKGPLPVETALQYARQVSEALEAAHEKNIIHRDLKPANIMITAAGVVKVLDFGLAKAADDSAAAGDPSVSPTLTMSPTQAGMILGTAAYMSPEQARGKPVDKRADVWAFGVVLYEMLTGRQTFAGETVTDVLASVVKDQPALERLPGRVRGVVERCIKKDPRQRWQAIGDVRVEIEALLADPRGALAEDQRPAPRPLWKRAIPVVATGVLAAAIAGFVAWRFKPSVPPTIARFPVFLPEGQQFTSFNRLTIGISPDGTQIAYSANSGLYLRPMAELEARAIPGSDIGRGIANPVFSPDGRSIAFSTAADSMLKRIAVTGGSAVTICQAGNPWGMTWGEDGIVFGEGDRGIFRVSPNGGKPELLVEAKRDQRAAHPQMLPGGQAVLFTIANGDYSWDQAQIVVQTLKTGVRKTVIEGGSDARYLPTGHIVYALSGTLFAVPFDLRRLEVTGGPVPIIEGITRSTLTGAAQYNFSRTGALAYIPGPVSASSGQGSLALVDRKGAVEQLNLPAGTYAYPRVSRDAKHLAYETDNGKEAIIWIYDLSGARAPRRLTFQGVNRYPIWSADGERIAFQSDREGDLGIFWQRADGTGAAERLTKPEKGMAHVPDSWSPDGQQLSFSAVQGNAASVWTYSLRERKATVFAESGSSSSEASEFSPDGRWVAYQSNETGTREVYVRPFPPSAAKYQIHSGGANGDVHPLWSRDGKELTFSTGPATFASVSLTVQPSFTFSSPIPVPRGGMLGTPTGARNYDILPDGRFLGVVVAGQAREGSAAPQLRVVLNWLDDVKQRVPVR